MKPPGSRFLKRRVRAKRGGEEPQQRSQTLEEREREVCGGFFIWLMREEGGRVRVWRVKRENR